MSIAADPFAAETGSRAGPRRARRRAQQAAAAAGCRPPT